MKWLEKVSYELIINIKHIINKPTHIYKLYNVHVLILCIYSHVLKDTPPRFRPAG